MEKTDLIIIGAGPGGYHTAVHAAKEGLKVTIIEKKHPGGTCLNEGCIPTKSFAHDADLYRNPLLSCVGGGHVNFDRIQQRKTAVINQLREGVKGLLSQPGITYIEGEAKFVDKKVIEVNNTQMTADNIIIATGSHARMLPFIPNLDSPEGATLKDKIMTSTELLDISHVPNSMAIIGAGVIGLELASAFETFGSSVTVIEFLKECLPTMDSDIAKRLRKNMEKRGISFNLQSGVTAIEPTADQKQVVISFNQKGQDKQVTADVVLIATGRAANVEGLGLETAGINCIKQGIETNENYETNVPGVYAIGDVNGKQMLAHAASFQGMRVINKILNKTDKIRFDIMPAAVFTYPEAGSVGMSEDACKKAGMKCTVKKGFYRSNGKALAMEETEGLLKVIADENGKIIGCHVFGAHSADMTQEVAVLMNHDATLNDLRDIIHIHPTLGEILLDAIN
ncbi:dihydrolipoyl dehydrogenase [Prevotella brunnea]|uniref:Dihydrolipoyl dehydrogenase n=1 Tax=Prevotella brunnea TaxID=2508867 RepID=A0A5C8GPS5_9BACT|nr:dihydrolipoyl dehydrogenase [Prevotella brunnea]MDR0185222.1 dihydrolipoyl dehydrogenase [Prevotella brunnea]TXJ63183.1 dihydrolipoyl dehydrogenase [Prevotella brunnea]